MHARMHVHVQLLFKNSANIEARANCDYANVRPKRYSEARSERRDGLEAELSASGW